ncbi:MAG: hypothetical protein GX548_11085 [Lentisphaerae bacterium]|nr:hypothetical protein [Lentisphaerota bacterium]
MASSRLADDFTPGAFWLRLRNDIAPPLIGFTIAYRVYCYNNAATGPNFHGDGSYSNCCTAPMPKGGDGNFTGDPLCASAATGDWRLGAGSPCVDAGLYIPWMETAADLGGEPRVRFDAVDCGAYEYNPHVYDSDGGGLTDADELLIYGTHPAKINTDGDGFTDWEEMVAVTDGADADAYFRVTAISNLPPVRVYFDSSASRVYTLYACENLAAGTWLPVPGMAGVYGKDGPDFLVHTNAATSCHYRIGVSLP